MGRLRERVTAQEPYRDGDERVDNGEVVLEAELRVLPGRAFVRGEALWLTHLRELGYVLRRVE